MSFRNFLLSLCGIALCVAVLTVIAPDLFAQPEPVRGHTATPWQLLASIETYDISDDIVPNMIKTFPPDLRAAADGFAIEGYLMRFAAEPYLQEFLLLPDPPECPYCGGAGYGPFLEVIMREPLDDLPNYTQ
ncbi:MAG: hypothetical protein AAF724_23415, partial [Pseudomonadota bacterium]